MEMQQEAARQRQQRQVLTLSRRHRGRGDQESEHGRCHEVGRPVDQQQPGGVDLGEVDGRKTQGQDDEQPTVYPACRHTDTCREETGRQQKHEKELSGKGGLHDAQPPVQDEF